MRRIHLCGRRCGRQKRLYGNGADAQRRGDGTRAVHGNVYRYADLYGNGASRGRHAHLCRVRPEEVGLRFAAGDASIVFGECGSATFTAADGTGYTGTYAAVSEGSVLRIFLSATTYLEMPEYVFRSSDGKFTQYFVPVPYTSYDGSLQAGELLLSDGLRGKTFRLYNENNELTGEFETYGYGLGVLRIFASQDGTVHDSAVAETIVTYDLLREQDGKPLYRLRNDWDQGFFAFVPTDTKTPDGNAWVAETDEVYAEWWRDPAALYVTGVIEANA